MGPIDGRLCTIVVEQVPARDQDFEGVDRVALRDGQGIVRAELGPDIHVVLGVGLARTFARPEREPCGGLWIGEAAHGIPPTWLTRVICARPARVESLTNTPVTSYRCSSSWSPSLTALNRTRLSMVSELEPVPDTLIRQRRSVITEPAFS